MSDDFKAKGYHSKSEMKRIETLKTEPREFPHKCELCSTPVKVVGDTTKSYESAYDQLAKENEKMKWLLGAIKKHGLCHFQDCPNSGYDDEDCACGMEKLEQMILSALGKK